MWSILPAPQIAKNYWRLSDNAMMRDVLLAVRADEANHREYVKNFFRVQFLKIIFGFRVNHELADVGSDSPNPFLIQTKKVRSSTSVKEQQEIDRTGTK